MHPVEPTCRATCLASHAFLGRAAFSDPVISDGLAMDAQTACPEPGRGSMGRHQKRRAYPQPILAR